VKVTVSCVDHPDRPAVAFCGHVFQYTKNAAVIAGWCAECVKAFKAGTSQRRHRNGCWGGWSLEHGEREVSWWSMHRHPTSSLYLKLMRATKILEAPAELMTRQGGAL